MFKDGWFVEDFKGQVGGLSFKVDDLLFEEQSAYQKVTVLYNSFFGNVMLLDDLVMLTEKDEFYYHDMLVHVPMAYIPTPKEVLIIGGGDGGSVREALKYPSVEKVTLCEIDQTVIDVARKYFPSVAGALSDDRVEINVGDGIEYIKHQKDAFDCIMIDSTDSIGPAGGLFSLEFYRAAREALRDGGTLSAQTEPPTWSLADVATINRKIGQAMGNARLYTLPVPSYPSGLWSCTLSTKPDRGIDNFDHERSAMIGSQCKYYNPDIHKAAFALPNFIREAL